MAGTTSYYDRSAQYSETTGGGQLNTVETVSIVIGDVSGASALYTTTSGTDPLTGESVSTADRVEAGAHLMVGLAGGEAGGRFGAKFGPQFRAWSAQKSPTIVGSSSATTGAGAARVGRYSEYWSEASLGDTIKNIAGDNPVVWTTRTGKTIFTNPQTGIQVVYDRAGNYFRVYDPKTATYLDRNGNPIPSNVPLVKANKTTQTGIPRDVRESISHFRNADTHPPEAPPSTGQSPAATPIPTQGSDQESSNE